MESVVGTEAEIEAWQDAADRNTAAVVQGNIQQILGGMRGTLNRPARPSQGVPLKSGPLERQSGAGLKPLAIEGSQFSVSPLARVRELQGALFALNQETYSEGVLGNRPLIVGKGLIGGSDVTVLATSDSRIYRGLAQVKNTDEILLPL